MPDKILKGLYCKYQKIEIIRENNEVILYDSKIDPKTFKKWFR